VAEREAHGPYRSLDDLCERLDLRTVNKRVLEALTKGGALDSFGPRERVLAALDRTMSAAQQVQRAAGIGQQSLFGGDSGLTREAALPVVPPPNDQQRLIWEKEALGFFLSHHPFEAAARALADQVSTNTSQLSEESENERVTLAGAIMSVRKIVTKKQETMVVAQLEDLHGAISAVVFPRVYALDPEVWQEDAILVVAGRIAIRRMDASADEEARGVPEILVERATRWVPGEAPPVQPSQPPALDPMPVAMAESAAPAPRPAVAAVPPPPVPVEAAAELESAEEVAERLCRQILFLFRETGDRSRDFDRLRRLHTTLSRCDGDDTYAIAFLGTAGRRRLVSESFRVSYSPDLEREVEAILGTGCVRVQ
jgi:DNA polymerase-3 subunit alpha